MESEQEEKLNGVINEMSELILTHENEMKEKEFLLIGTCDTEMEKDRSFRHRIEHELGKVALHNVAMFIFVLSGYMLDERLADFMGGIVEIALGHSERLMRLLRDNLNKRLGDTGGPTNEVG